MIFYDLILNFLLFKNFSLLSTRNPQQSYQADVPIPSLSLTSLSEAELHLTIRPVSTKMSKQTQASVISKRAGRRTPLTPTPKPLRTCKRLQPKRFRFRDRVIEHRFEENIKLRMRNTFEIYTTTFNFSIHYLLSKKKNLQKQRSIFPLKRT